jgi:SAM-dependent methyltransferase
MHIQARQFTEFVKSIFPDFFINKKVLDVGSGDINGNNRFLFTDCEYDGNDVCEAPNVTVVSRTKNLPFDNSTFDTIISTECFEHDPDYEDSFKKIYNMLKPGGLFVFTCASTGRAEHGTRRTSSGDSYGTMAKIEDMHDYYKNLTEVDINNIIRVNTVFKVFKFYYNSYSKDLYFVGVKHGSSVEYNIPEYITTSIVNTTSNII